MRASSWPSSGSALLRSDGSVQRSVRTTTCTGGRGTAQRSVRTSSGTAAQHEDHQLHVRQSVQSGGRAAAELACDATRSSWAVGGVDSLGWANTRCMASILRGKVVRDGVSGRGIVRQRQQQVQPQQGASLALRGTRSTGGMCQRQSFQRRHRRRRRGLALGHSHLTDSQW